MESLEIEETRKNDFSVEEREDEEDMAYEKHVYTKSMGIWNVKRRKRSLVSLIVLLISVTIVYVVVLATNDNMVVEGYDAQVGKQEGGPGFCDYSEHDQWLKAKISKQDGKMYSVLDTLFHDSSSFTQGLTYKRYGDHGLLFESTGLRGQSKVRILDPLTGATIKSINMDRELFGEGMTVFHDKLVQITWKSQKGFVYNTTNLDVIETFTFDTTRNEGWGITYDHCKDEFIVTDGSAYMHFWDPSTLKQKRKIAVRRMDGKPAKNLNEVEYWRGKLLSNVWYEDVLLVIDPTTGLVEKEYDFSALWPTEDRATVGADVFNGISVSNVEDELYVTGKKWDRIFKVKLEV